MWTNLNYYNDEFDFIFILNDIGYEKDKSFCVKNNDDMNKDAIELCRDKNNFINLNLGFKSIILNEEFFLSFLIHLKQRKKKIKNYFMKKNIVIKLKKNRKKKKTIKLFKI